MAHPFSLSYNGYEIGGANAATLPYGTETFTRKYDGTFSIRCRFILQGSTPANYKTAEDAMVAALTPPSANFTLVVASSGQTFQGVQLTSVGNVVTELRAPGDQEADSDRTLLWEFTITWRGPASSTSFLRTATTGLTFSAGRLKQAIITGEYTYGSGVTARAKYNSLFTAYATAELTALDGTANWQLVSEGPATHDREKHTLTFTATYRQVRTTTGVADVKNESVRMTLQRGRVKNAQRRVVHVDYRGHLDISAVVYADHAEKLEAVRDALLTMVETTWDVDVATLEEETLTLQEDTGEISGGLSVVITASSYTFRRRESVEVTQTPADLKLLALKGMYHTDDAGEDAEDKFTADFVTWANATKTAVDGAVTWEEVDPPSFTRDGESAELVFSATFRERSYSVADSVILGEKITFTRFGTWKHGLSTGAIAEVMGAVNYFAFVKKSATEAQLAAKWIALRSTLIGKAAAYFGGPVTIKSESFQVDPVTMSVSGSYQLWFALRGNRVIRHDETVHYSFNEGLERRLVLSGEKNQYHLFRATGPEVLATISLIREERTLQPEVAFDAADVDPPPPPAKFGAAPAGRWIRLEGGFSFMKVHHGRMPDSGGQIQTVVESRSSVQKLWVSNKSAVVLPTSTLGEVKVTQATDLTVQQR